MNNQRRAPFALDVQSGKRSAYISGFLTIITTLLLIVIAAAFVSRSKDKECGYEEMKKLDPPCLRHFWKNNNDLQPITFSFQIISAVAAFLLIPPIMVMNEIFRRNGRPSQVLVPAIAAACAVRILEFTFNAGASMHSNWVARDWTLTDQDLKALTLSFLTVRSQGMWLFAMDYLFLAFGQISTSLLVYKCENTMPRWWAHLGMVAGVIGVINFLVELARLGSWFRMSEIAFLLQALDGFIMLPVWTLALGCKLYTASASSTDALMGGQSLVSQPQSLELSNNGQGDDLNRA